MPVGFWDSQFDRTCGFEEASGPAENSAHTSSLLQRDQSGRVVQIGISFSRRGFVNLVDGFEPWEPYSVLPGGFQHQVNVFVHEPHGEIRGEISRHHKWSLVVHNAGSDHGLIYQAH